MSGLTTTLTTLTTLATLGARCATAALTLGVLPVLVTALTSGAADAGELRYHDATGDVQTLDAASGLLDPDGRPVTDPSVTDGDIESVFVHYRAGRLVIRADYRELARRRDTQLTFTGEITSGRHRRWGYVVTTTPGRYAGHDELVTLRGPHHGRSCEIGHTFDYARNFTRVSVPLRCLGRPRWVRVSVGAVTMKVDQEALEEFFSDPELEADDPIPPGLLVVGGDDAGRGVVTDRLRWTPRVYR